MFWNHYAAMYYTPETILIHKEENTVVYEQRKSVFLPQEAVVRTRYTCRNEQGEVRLMPKASVFDALERLCQIEEQTYGILIRRKPGQEVDNAETED